jgi:FAD/FMN-containing dehydrogenase/Fe-S oxidoreductase
MRSPLPVQNQRARPAAPAAPPAPSGDAASLADELRRRVSGEVRFDDGSRALYSTDASNYRQIPIGVVVPREVSDVVETVATCRRFGVPIVSRGGGTSLAGQTCNVAVVIDWSKYLNRIVDLDVANQRARVLPGCVLDHLRDEAWKHHLTFGPDPATHSHNTLGGMIGNNSCGVHSVMAGKTDDNVEELEILTYDGLRLRVGMTTDEDYARIIQEGGRRGEIYARLKNLRDRYGDLIRARFPDIPRRVSGYALHQLLPEKGFNVARALVGTEGTCVTVLEATLRLVPWPRARTLLILGYNDIFDAGDHVPLVLDHRPIALEGVDQELTELSVMMGLHPSAIRRLPKGNGWLFVEFGGDTKAESDDKAQQLMESLKKRPDAPSMKLIDNVADEDAMWKVRESGLGATTFLPGPRHKIAWPGWEDSAVAPAKLGGYMRDFRKLLDRYEYHGSLYGHFGDGCLHTSTDFDLETPEGIHKFRSFIEDAADLVVRYGGSLSGEHGDGQARGELLGKMFGPELVQAFGEFKAIWDPTNKMNPGKVVDPYPLDSNLRLGVGYNPPADLKTHFSFIPDDNLGSFARATLRCVGVGDCRKTNTGTMCPSYMVTREEKHATRGRARLLFEMLRGEVIRDGWRSEEVKEALDLCLSCKGCKGDCPVNVDMATYKAEFLSHYYAGRLRPRTGYAFGLIMYWACAASLAPWLANLGTQLPLVSDLMKAALGIAPQRRIPAFAPTTFQTWFRQRGARNPDNHGAVLTRYASSVTRPSPDVILWPDTFNNHFFPDTAAAAVEVLEAAGFRVSVPEGFFCCGRPLYDYGMLDLAKRRLQDTIAKLRPWIRAGTPIVVLEPSCATVFRDEMPNLFPHDEDAKRLQRQVLLLSEFLAQKAPDFAPPKLARRALVHGHCHHKAIMKMTDEVATLRKTGLDFTVLDSGCCGMAGAFGFEAGDHYDVSMKVGERVLLPAVRQAADDTLIVTDGFSCREQIAQTTNRRAMHLAEVLRLALHGEHSLGARVSGGRLLGARASRPPVTTDITSGRDARAPSRTTAVLAVAGAIAAGLLSWTLKRQAQARHR